MKDSKIEWCDHTFNPWIGCTKVSAGCKNCYAENMNTRFKGGNWGKGAPRRRTSEQNWRQPLKWNRWARKSGIRKKVFCASMADWLDDEVPIEWLADLLQLIFHTPHLDWLRLTKRPQAWENRVSEALILHGFIGDEWLHGWLDGHWPSNVWIGTSVEDQKAADTRINQLLDIPAKYRFLSCEPLISPVMLSPFWLGGAPQVHWVIVGGESGPHARAFKPMWAESLRDECQAANVAFFMKQMGGTKKPFPPIPESLMIREFPDKSF